MFWIIGSGAAGLLSDKGSAFFSLLFIGIGIWLAVYVNNEWHKKNEDD